MGLQRRHASGARSGATAIGIVALGWTLDLLSTLVGHRSVTGVEEWNVVVLSLAAWLPFSLAVLLLKVGALGVVAAGVILVWRRDGPWELCLAAPGVLWTGVGLLNALTILIAL